jgi:hypothetical protein
MSTLNNRGPFGRDTRLRHNGGDMQRQNTLERATHDTAAPHATGTAGTVRDWNALALRTLDATRPARALALLHTCMYNAWAAYDGDARQTVHGVTVRLPRAERDAVSKAAAMSHAAYGVLAGLCPDAHPDAAARMRDLGLVPAADAGPFTPAGIGGTQAAALLDVRHRDRPFALMPAEVRPPGAARPLALAAVWCDVAQRVSVRDGHDDDRDVLLFLVLTNALADADAASGDAACAAFAAAEVLHRFTGGDCLDAVTFTEVAAQAGPGPGREMGRKIGARVFDKARRYWQGRL